MIKAGIIGSTGYAGQELVRLLLGHKDVEIVWYGSRSYIDKKYYDVFRNMFQIVDDVCKDDNMDELAEAVDVIFTATPQGLCASLVSEEVLNKVKIIDLSADFRMKDVATYENGTASNIHRRNLFRKRSMACVRLTGKLSGGHDSLPIRAVIRHVPF